MVMFTCINCGSIRTKGKCTLGKYCSNSCQQIYQDKVRITKWLNGEIPGWTGKTRQLKYFVRKWLHSVRGTGCEICGWDEHHPEDGSVMTEVDHIDGDAENCSPDNLKILCPNCHSLTSTFRVRNKNSKRVR